MEKEIATQGLVPAKDGAIKKYPAGVGAIKNTPRRGRRHQEYTLFKNTAALPAVLLNDKVWIASINAIQEDFAIHRVG